MKHSEPFLFKNTCYFCFERPNFGWSCIFALLAYSSKIENSWLKRFDILQCIHYSDNHNFDVQEEKSSPTFDYLVRPFPFTFTDIPDEPTSSSSSSASSSLSSSLSPLLLLLAHDTTRLDVSAFCSFATTSCFSSVDGASARAASNCLSDFEQASHSLRTDHNSLSYASSHHWRVSMLWPSPSRVLKKSPEETEAFTCRRSSLRPGSEG